MNPLTNTKNLQKLNERELALGQTNTSKSWHAKYADSAWVFVGGLPYELTEGDVVCVFSQYGEIVNINLVRDKDTGKSKGFCFICYEDQRSTVLAVDNLNSVKLLNRTIRVDHVENYRVPKEFGDEDETTTKLRREGCAPTDLRSAAPQQLGTDVRSDTSAEEGGRRKVDKKHKKKKKKEKVKLSAEEKMIKKLKLKKKPTAAALPGNPREESPSKSQSSSVGSEKRSIEGMNVGHFQGNHFVDAASELRTSKSRKLGSIDGRSGNDRNGSSDSRSRRDRNDGSDSRSGNRSRDKDDSRSQRDTDKHSARCGYNSGEKYQDDFDSSDGRNKRDTRDISDGRYERDTRDISDGRYKRDTDTFDSRCRRDIDSSDRKNLRDIVDGGYRRDVDGPDVGYLRDTGKRYPSRRVDTSPGDDARTSSDALRQRLRSLASASGSSDRHSASESSNRHRASENNDGHRASENNDGHHRHDAAAHEDRKEKRVHAYRTEYDAGDVRSHRHRDARDDSSRSKRRDGSRSPR